LAAFPTLAQPFDFAFIPSSTSRQMAFSQGRLPGQTQQEWVEDVQSEVRKYRIANSI
jgi:hypothetical protein